MAPTRRILGVSPPYGKSLPAACPLPRAQNGGSLQSEASRLASVVALFSSQAVIGDRAQHASVEASRFTDSNSRGEREAAHAQAADSTTIAGQSSGRAPSGSGGVANSGSRARQAGNQQGRAGEGAPGNQTESLIIK
uniref:Uncharacterized protein n=1 Tax=Oryza sativa subsp. japonica TaxID=39947 RepID=Q6Z9N9_ORYSJ|nr:hypothetical protein [Oryza sativa Japonica Group]